MANNRAERLLAIVLVLLSTRRPLTRSEIRDAVRDYPDGQEQTAFERMFERDKDELRGMGIPVEAVETDDVEGIGYRLAAATAFLRHIDLDPAEAVVLGLASRLWDEATWGHDALNAVRKLELVGEFTSEESAGSALSVRVNSVVLTKLLDAAATRCRVQFKYRKPGMPVADDRSVEPWGVVATRGQWYLVGHDTDRCATRAFRLSRVLGDVSIQKPVGSYQIPTDVDLQSLVMDSFPGSDLIDVTVAIDPQKAPRLRWLATAVDDDVVTFAAVDPDRILSEVLAATPHVTVLSPESFRDRVVAGLAKIADSVGQPLADFDRQQLDQAAHRAAKSATEDAAAQVSRLLALVPWLLSNSGTTYEDAAAHFGVSVEKLHSDLELAICTEFGSNLLTLDIDIWGNRINVRDAQGIRAPLRLTPSEGISLLIGLRLLEQVPGPHDRAALARAISKVEQAAGPAAELADLVSIPIPSSVQSGLSSDISTALASSRALRIRYWSASRDEVSDRIVDPISLATTAGTSYLQAWSREADAVRLFRVDRIQELEFLDEPISIPSDLGVISPAFDPHGFQAVIEVDRAVTWWADQVPSQAVFVRSDGSVLISLAVVSRTWLVRTVLSFAGQLRIVEPAELALSVQSAAVAGRAKNAK